VQTGLSFVVARFRVRSLPFVVSRRSSTKRLWSCCPAPGIYLLVRHLKNAWENDASAVSKMVEQRLPGLVMEPLVLMTVFCRVLRGLGSKSGPGLRYFSRSPKILESRINDTDKLVSFSNPPQKCKDASNEMKRAK
jgi:hypothetical protein